MANEPFRVIVTGSRDWHCVDLATDVVGRLQAKHGDRLVIVEGGAKGVDESFAIAAEWKGVKLETVKAEWKEYGKRAGPLRNQAMVDRGASLCVAVHRHILDSKGTRDCVIRSAAAGIPVWLLQDDTGVPKRLTEDHLSAIRRDLGPEPEPEGRVEEAESEAEACAILADEEEKERAIPREKAAPPRKLIGYICTRGKGCQPIVAHYQGHDAEPPGVVAESLVAAALPAPPAPVPFEEVLLRGEYPQFGQPRVGFWSHVLGSIQQFNGRWRGDYPTEPEPIHWEEVVIHLAWVASNAKLHGHNPMDEKIDLEEWVGILAGVHGANKRSRADAEFLEGQLTHYLENALRRAEERLQAPAEPEAPPPPPERHKGRKAPPPSKAAAEAKLEKAARKKAESGPKKKSK